MSRRSGQITFLERQHFGEGAKIEYFISKRAERLSPFDLIAINGIRFNFSKKTVQFLTAWRGHGRPNWTDKRELDRYIDDNSEDFRSPFDYIEQYLEDHSQDYQFRNDSYCLTDEDHTEIASQAGNQLEVSAIMGIKISQGTHKQRSKADQTVEFLVKWKGYPLRYMEWIRQSDMHCPDMMERYANLHGHLERQIAKCKAMQRAEEREITEAVVYGERNLFGDFI
ncbi:hypothetical protein HDE_09402 [Halotydeus destructor]|nr:hypothetical protein HDE_09402 [Halotydeus destructor]